MRSGVYCIINKINSKRYVGSSKNIKGRWNEHLQNLQIGRASLLLQNAWDKYGSINFEFIILEYCQIEKLIEKEQYWINHFNSHYSGHGYNILSIAGSLLGFKHSKETRYEMSRTRKGRAHSQETKEKIRQGNTNKIFSEERKGKISKANKGRTKSEDFKKNLSKIFSGSGNPNYGKHPWKYKEHPRGMLGKKVSEETRKKLSLSHKGRVSWNKGVKGHFHHSKEWKEEISKRYKGIKRPIEVGRKVSQTKQYNSIQRKQVILYKTLFPQNYGELLNIVNY